MTTNQEYNLSPKYLKALKYAYQFHHDQFRKGSRIPYFAHLLAVSGLVMEHGGDETESIAALLHDAVEDSGGLATLEIIRQEFGDQVASIVEACSDSTTSPKPPWRKRKEGYLKKLETASSSVILVSQADKLHNLRSICTDYRRDGKQIWKYFRGGKDGSLWYYHQLVQIFRKHGSTPMLTEIQNLLDELEELIKTKEASLPNSN